jgi:acyl carrier protein
VSSAPLTYGEFSSTLADYFEIPIESFGERAHLIDDLGFDSVMFVELTFMLEAVAGHELAIGATAGLATLSDVYNMYTQFSEARPAER